MVTETAWITPRTRIVVHVEVEAEPRCTRHRCARRGKRHNSTTAWNTRLHSSSASVRNRRSYSWQFAFTADRSWPMNACATSRSNSSRSASARAGDSLSANASISASAACNSRLVSSAFHWSSNLTFYENYTFLRHVKQRDQSSRASWPQWPSAMKIRPAHRERQHLRYRPRVEPKSPRRQSIYEAILCPSRRNSARLWPPQRNSISSRFFRGTLCSGWVLGCKRAVEP
jgi:hypothetical protein